MNREPCIVNICGNIASGKSTLVAALQDQLNIASVMEDTSRISLFTKYCEDPRKWAAATQLQFLADKLARAVGALGNGPTLLDRSLYEDAVIFAGLHCELGNITVYEYNGYLKLFEAAESYLPKKQLNILVLCSRSEQKSRLRNRSDAEQTMLTDDYLNMIEEKYRRFVIDFSFDIIYESGVNSMVEISDSLERLLSKG